MSLFFEQALNGVQQGLLLFLLAAGLTLTFGIMGVINLAHGSLYMAGAYAGALAAGALGSYWAAPLAAVLAAGTLGLVVERGVIRRLYDRPHLDQVLATFGLILLLNGLTTLLFGRSPLYLAAPEALSGGVVLPGGVPYPAYRLAMMAASLAVALGLYLLINKTRLGMLIRAGADDRETVAALGCDIDRLYTIVFALGAALAGFAGALVAPILAVQVGMGERILILTFVVVIVGGVGSVKGAFVGALVVGLTDTLGRAYLPGLLKATLPPAYADGAAAALASVLIYLVMAGVLVVRPQGLFGR